jgi:hypothetical protein
MCISIGSCGKGKATRMDAEKRACGLVIDVSGSVSI